jgi:hypothetical protein
MPMTSWVCRCALSFCRRRKPLECDWGRISATLDNRAPSPIAKVSQVSQSSRRAIMFPWLFPDSGLLSTARDEKRRVSGLACRLARACLRQNVSARRLHCVNRACQSDIGPRCKTSEITLAGPTASGLLAQVDKSYPKVHRYY